MGLIASVNDYLAATKQRIELTRTGARTTVSAGWFSTLDLAGYPGAGTLAGANTANGVVPDDSTPGCPPINGSTGTWQLTKVNFSSSVACRMIVFDLLFKAGAYAFNANTALSSQPSYSARIPGGDYKGTEIWVEQVTAATGHQAVNVTYTDQDGTPGATTGAVGIGAAPTIGRCWQLPFAPGDSGVQKIENVAGSVASAGTFNVLVMRPLWSARVRMANDGDVHDLLRTGAVQLFGSSALVCLIAPDSTAIGLPGILVEISNVP